VHRPVLSLHLMTTQPILESERRTRKRRVDPNLRAWGWEVVPFDAGKPLSGHQRHAIEEYPTVNGPADYALVTVLASAMCSTSVTGSNYVIHRPMARRMARR